MSTWIAVLAAVIGYLAGSISFARVIVKLVAPDKDVTQVSMPIPGSDETHILTSVGGTSVGLQLGAKWGGITAILDILKVAIPTLVIKLVYPQTPYFLLTAVAGLVGHNWPIYHRFHGGAGMSAIYGGMLAVDWIGALVVSTLGMILGMVVLKNVVIAYFSGLWFIIPWLWFRTHNWAFLAYGVAVNVIFMLGMIPEMKQMLERRRKGIKDDFSAGMNMLPMGRMMIKMMKSLGLKKDQAE